MEALRAYTTLVYSVCICMSRTEDVIAYHNTQSKRIFEQVRMHVVHSNSHVHSNLMHGQKIVECAVKGYIVKATSWQYEKFNFFLCLLQAM